MTTDRGGRQRIVRRRYCSGWWGRQVGVPVGPEYLADVRCRGHVDDYVIATELSDVLAVPASTWEPHFVLTLGPAIRPDRALPTGERIQRGRRVWADIDLLLTAPTISDAETLTKRRHLA